MPSTTDVVRPLSPGRSRRPTRVVVGRRGGPWGPWRGGGWRGLSPGPAGLWGRLVAGARGGTTEDREGFGRIGGATTAGGGMSGGRLRSGRRIRLNGRRRGQIDRGVGLVVARRLEPDRHQRRRGPDHGAEATPMSHSGGPRRGRSRACRRGRQGIGRYHRDHGAGGVGSVSRRGSVGSRRSSVDGVGAYGVVDRGGRQGSGAGLWSAVRPDLLHDHRLPRAVPAHGRRRGRASILAHRPRA